VVKTQDSLLDFVHWESATRQRDLHPRHLRQPVDTRWFRGPGRDSVRHGHRVSLCLKSHRMPPAARCRQAFSAPTECSLARQVILPCPFLDRFPAGSEGPPAVRSLKLPDRQTSPRTIGKSPGAAHLSGTGLSSRRWMLPLTDNDLYWTTIL